LGHKWLEKTEDVISASTKFMFAWQHYLIPLKYQM
jgi:hypothetical protein